MKKYRLVETIGRFWNKRWELQEQYSYWERGKQIISWHMVMCGEKRFCEEALQKRLQNGGCKHETSRRKNI